MKFSTVFLYDARFVVSVGSHAMDSPEWVFKIDRKQPGDAFANGSITLGLDRDLVQFISGRAVKDGKTSCTSTTEEHPDINAVCKKIARHSRDQIIYHYRKRPSLNFLNLEVSLQSVEAALPDDESRRQLHDIWRATRDLRH